MAELLVFLIMLAIRIGIVVLIGLGVRSLITRYWPQNARFWTSAGNAFFTKCGNAFSAGGSFCGRCGAERG